MSWYSLGLNPEAILSLYPSAPSLELLDVFKVHLQRDGPSLSIEAELPIFPERPSPRWDKAYSAAQVKVDFIGVRALSIVGWGTTSRLVIQAEKNDEAINVSLVGKNVSITFVADFLRILGIVGYAKSA